jgi:hypothetical protein
MDKWQADDYKKKYTELIEKSLSYPEVLSVKGEEVVPFRTPFYSCDRGMLWAANYLTL